MPRVPRCLPLVAAVCFHLINRGHNREVIFADDEDRRVFLDLLARYGDRFGFSLHHSCLMSNHCHWLVRLEAARRLSALLAGLLGAYVHHSYRRQGFVGNRWQGRFKSPAVQDGVYLLSCGRYIERNPLEVGLCSEPWQ